MPVQAQLQRRAGAQWGVSKLESGKKEIKIILSSFLITDISELSIGKTLSLVRLELYKSVRIWFLVKINSETP